MDKMLKVRDKILHTLERNEKFYNIYFSNQDNAIELDYDGESFKLTIEKIQEGEQLNMNIVVIDFCADWCSPCKMQNPILEVLKKKYGDKVEFKKVNVDGKKDERKLSEKHHINAVPTIIIEKNGKVEKRYVGVTSLKVLEKDIEVLI